MKTSQNGRKFIEEFEGLILQSYDDYNDHIVNSGDTIHGVLTIGYGHTSAAGPPVVFGGQTFTKDEADQVLAQDLGRVENQVNTLVTVPINQNQFDALVSFEFNTGGLGHSTLLKNLNAKDYHGAADQFLVWNKAGGRILAGLVRRRQKEREMFLKDVSVPTPTVSSWNPFINSIINLFANIFKKGK